MLLTAEIAAVLIQLETYKVEHSAELRPALRLRIQELNFGPAVDTIVKTAETLYAARDEVGAAGQRMLAELFYTASAWSFHGVNIDGRAGRIIAGVRRDLGEDAPVMGWPDAATDPDAKPEYVVVEPAAPDLPNPAG